MGNKQAELNNSGNRVETVPVWVKPYLTIDEATAYTGIGRDKLYEMTSQEKCPFVLWVGNRRMIKCILRHTAAVGAVVQRPLCGLSSGRN
ncbi:excisionase [Candidatus Agathobaculum pullicola]|uniref:excisionase n=1 Tax=Candidatus Agathobaculum pullicola TaxID=2838426 RepID=UPI003F8FB390